MTDNQSENDDATKRGDELLRRLLKTPPAPRRQSSVPTQEVELTAHLSEADLADLERAATGFDGSVDSLPLDVFVRERTPARGTGRPGKVLLGFRLR